MEPRWRKSWRDYGPIYLGGTNDFDLWFDGEKDIRVVWGERKHHWDYFFWSFSAEAYLWGSGVKEGTGHDKVLGESLAYIRIFAPWVEDEAKNKELSNDEDNG